MKEIKAFKTSDGEVFESEAQAANHEFCLKLRGRFEEFAEKYHFSNITHEDLADILYENRVELKDILTKA